MPNSNNRSKRILRLLEQEELEAVLGAEPSMGGGTCTHCVDITGIELGAEPSMGGDTGYDDDPDGGSCKCRSKPSVVSCPKYIGSHKLESCSKNVSSVKCYYSGGKTSTLVNCDDPA